MPQNRRSYEKTRRIALSGLLFALAMALSFIEGTLTIPGLLPGMKLGLANIVVMYALFFMGPESRCYPVQCGQLLPCRNPEGQRYSLDRLCHRGCFHRG